jgi:carboxyl-terminal processing protease
MTGPNAPRGAAAVACVLLVQLVAALTLVSYRAGLAQAGQSSLPPEFATVAEVYQRIRREAVEVPADKALAEGAVQGMLGALEDPHAAYYSANDFASFNQLLDGEFSGVGVQIQESDQGPIVVSVIASTPAAEAGVVKGERIVAVDGKNVRGMPTEGVAALITGEAGTLVVLGLDGGPAGPREVRLTRAQIQLPDVESRLEGGIGYVGLVQFSSHAGMRVREAALQLIARGARGIVLDLRGNPGGLLREAVEVASVFVEDGVVVSVRTRGEEAGGREYEAEGDALESIPLVLLVDGWSASASEIVAAAIQDLGRGELVGEKTFGKGTVQTVQVLGDGGGVKFTTAEYLTPSGDSIEDVGVVPDRQVSGEDAQLAAARSTLQQLLVAR